MSSYLTSVTLACCLILSNIKPFPLASCKPKPRLDDFHRATRLTLVGNTPCVALSSGEGVAEGAARGEAVVRSRPLSLYRGDGTGGAAVAPSVSPLFLAQKRDSHRGKRLMLPVSRDYGVLGVGALLLL